MAITHAEMLEQWQRAIAQIGQGSLECCFKGRGSGGETKLNFTQLNAWKGLGVRFLSRIGSISGATPPETNMVHLKIPPKGKGETSTEHVFLGSMLNFGGVP